jgi:hypothetical protein
MNLLNRLIARAFLSEKAQRKTSKKGSLEVVFFVKFQTPEQSSTDKSAYREQKDEKLIFEWSERRRKRKTFKSQFQFGWGKKAAIKSLFGHGQ